MGKLITLTGADRDRFARFYCSTGAPWADEVQDAIQHDAAGELEGAPATWGLGIDENGELAALVIWFELGDSNWKLDLVATALGHREQGHAHRLVNEVVERARDAHVELLIAEVVVENSQMGRVLTDLGAQRFWQTGAAKAYYTFYCR